jgi:ATP-dependent DNA ligase
LIYSDINAFRMLCTSEGLLKSALKEIIVVSGGEGIILQRRRSLYEQGRSTNLFKIKVC